MSVARSALNLLSMDGNLRGRPDSAEALWRNTFFGLSALMGAFALLDFDAGRWAGGLGDAGVACLLLSLMTQFPFIRAVVGAASRGSKSRDELMREAERLRLSNPWAERLATAGWSLLLASIVLRALGVD